MKWFDRLPTHWEVRRLRNVADLRVSSVDKHKREDEEHVRLCNYVDVYNNDRITTTMNFMHATAAPDEIERFRLERGDVLITKDSETWDDIGIPALVTDSAPDLISGYHLALLRPRSEHAVGGYLFRALESKGISRQFHVQARGVTRFGLTHVGIKSVWLPVPSLSEQVRIVRFLDHADRLIQRYIFAKQKLIALLEEQKQASIHQAVTGQIDLRSGRRYTAYKSSGPEWLKEVPAHWTRCRLKSVLRSVDRRSKTGRETLLSLRRDHGVVAYADHFSRPSQGNSLVGYKLVSSGQLVVNRMQANNGLVFRSKIGGLVSPDYSVFEEKEPLQMQFLSDLLRTPEYRTHFRKEATGLGTGNSGFLRLYDGRFLDTIVFLPPREEQVAVLEYLSTNSRKMSRLKLMEQRALERMVEWRTRLVADVVTGKLDVRDSTKELPNIDHLEAGYAWSETLSDEMHASGGESGKSLDEADA